jgi:non-ribosomal peptide synthetase component F
LPTDRPRPPVQTHDGARYAFRIEPELTERLKALSRREGVTLFMTLLAAVKLLLSRYSGQTDITIGTDVANRERVETEGLIGYFVNLLVLRTDLSGDPTFKELLRRVRETALDGYAHQAMPFGRLVDELLPQRDLSRPALFQVVFVLQNAPMGGLTLPGLTLTPIVVNSGISNFDFDLSMLEEAGGLNAAINYNTHLFDDTTITRLCRHLENLLRCVVAQPEARLSDIPVLTETERQGVSPDFFPDADLSQKDFEDLLLELASQ